MKPLEPKTSTGDVRHPDRAPGLSAENQLA
jgi:hypothetical protein